MSIAETNYNRYQEHMQKFTVGIVKISSSKIKGTGFIVSEEGWIITNNHVIRDSQENNEVAVYFPSVPSAQNTIRATVIKEYCDSKLDVAFLKLQGKLPETGIAIAYLDKSMYYSHKFKMFGFKAPLHQEFPGIIANITDGSIGQIRKYIRNEPIDLIQFESSQMSPGYSGSAIVDLSNGKVIGIVFEQAQSEGNLGFAIPVKSITMLFPLLEKINPGLSEHFVTTNIHTVFKSYEYFIKEFETVMNNERYTKVLSKIGGLFSLIVIGSNICQKIRNKGKSSAQIAFGNLLNSIFEVSKEIIESDFKEITKKEDTKTKNFSKGELNHNLVKNREKIREILSVFKSYDKWETYLLDHPSIKNFRDIITLYLIEENEEYVEVSTIRNFIMKFNLAVQEKIDNNKSIKEFYSWWTKKQNLKELVTYLEEVRANSSFRFDWDKKSLTDYYLPNRAFLADITTWEMSDETVENSCCHKDQIKIPMEIIELHFENEENQNLYIGGTWGIGKSTLCRKIAYDLAQNYLWCHDIENESLVHNFYVPIFCHLDTKIQSNQVSYLGNINKVLEMLNMIYSSNEQYKNIKVLLILDGLNEYPDGLEPIIDALNTYRSSYSNKIKAIITTKVSAEEDLQIIKQDISRHHRYQKLSYIRLLPFTNKQVSMFFSQYGIKKITHEYATSVLKWDGDQIKKPIFTWMLASIYSNPEHKIQHHKKWNETLLYFSFVKDVIRKSEYRQLNYTYKQIPRFIAALKSIHKDNLILGETEKDSVKVNLSDEIPKFDSSINGKDLESIHKPYLLQSVGEKMTVNFVHQTFGEYFLAEYYLDLLLNSNKSHRLNVGIPTDRTLYFLEGLIYLLKNDKKNNNIILEEFEVPGKFTDLDSALKKLCKSAFDSIINDSLTFYNLNQDNNDTIWTITKLEDKDYKLSWIHKWISVYILNSLISDRNLLNKCDKHKLSKLKEKLVDLIIYSGKVGVPNYLKRLNNFDLSDVNLIETNLSGADFSNNRKLICTNFFYAKLTYTNFNNTDLTFANFWRANLKNINFQNATLYGANCYLSEMRGSNLSHANLSHGEFYGVNLSRSNLSNADLSGANLSNADLSYADLSGANLSNADLSYANLSGANLSNADLSGANLSNAKFFDITDYVNLKCYKANLDNIIPNNNNSILGYLKKSKGKSKKYTDIEEVKERKKNNLLLTGIWRSNDGGTYFVHQIKNILWFLCISNAGNFAGIFRGEIVNDIIKGPWADIPLGEDMDYGELTLKIKRNEKNPLLIKINQTGGYGATIWKNIHDLPIRVNKKYSFDTIAESPILYNIDKKYETLTGIWRSSDGQTIHHSRQIGNYVWSCGINKKDGYVNVFRGKIVKDIIDGELAEVYREGNKKLKKEKMKLRISKSGNEVISLQQNRKEFYKL